MKEKKNYAKLIKILQGLSFAFMGIMIATMLILINKLDISIDNADKLAEYISGGTLTVAFIIIAFTVVKSFALVFPPAVIFAVSGLIIDNVWVAICINAVAVALSVILPYYFGRFAGKDLLDTLKVRFPKIKKLDDFAGKNEFMVV